MSYEVVARPLRVAVLTVSDTRTLETDKGGNKVQEFLEAANHIVADRKIVIDDCEAIINAMIPWCNDESIDVIISTGGTGIAMRDVTIEAVNSLYESIFQVLVKSLDIYPIRRILEQKQWHLVQKLVLRITL